MQTTVDIGADGTTLRSCRPAAVQPPSISSLQLYARVAAVVEAYSLIRACHLSPHHTPVLPLRARLHCMSIDRDNLNGSIGTSLIVIYLPTHHYIHVQIGRVFLRP